ncbi:unnamed protein product [Cuscuta epithymum]|uniref:Reverse transcriptase domain-containing protein n=1 Tax=Cuscuta epithymum TaxID=186058 RepID=A0AAV0G902_9ASTE|nr:unnamed protein product [Cuscuta epithymum]
MFWKQRAKEFWLKEGDINSRFFHNAIKQRRRRNTMAGLRQNDGVWITDRGDMSTIVHNYFDELFKNDDHGQPKHIRGEFCQVTAEQNLALLKPICPEEVKAVIFYMHPNKAPGFDGMNPAFFQAYWDVIGPDISALCRTMFESG